MFTALIHDMIMSASNMSDAANYAIALGKDQVQDFKEVHAADIAEWQHKNVLQPCEHYYYDGNDGVREWWRVKSIAPSHIVMEMMNTMIKNCGSNAPGDKVLFTRRFPRGESFANISYLTRGFAPRTTMNDTGFAPVRRCIQ
jgi:hypothetical protein